MDGDTCTDARVGLGAVAPTAVRVPDAEAALIGSSLDEAALAEVAAAASAAYMQPIVGARGAVSRASPVNMQMQKKARADRPPRPPPTCAETTPSLIPFCAERL